MKAIKLTFVFLFLSGFLLAQDASEDKPHSPTIGIGVGTIGFYGDLNDDDYGSPFTGNFGYNIYIAQPISNSFSVRFSFLLSKIREEERSLERNLNFESDIRSGSMLIEYNFANFLPEKRKITPFITTGVEIAEFNPKTDLEAFGGENYNYWTDGTIRNIAENDPDASQSVVIYRDYSYETDIREAGFNDSRTYSERSFVVPLGVGAILHLTDEFDFRLESMLHYSFSDYFDGITPDTKEEFVGKKKGNSRDDFFVYTGVSVSYNFQKVAPADKWERIKKDKTPIDYLASGNTEDFDQDGVIDLVDQCPNTPRSLEVDSLGCPVDSDGDGVPDYKDEEPNSEYPEFANDKGVEMTNDLIYESYMQFIDSTLEFAEVVQRDFTGKGRKANVKSYRVKVGEYEKGQTPADMSKLLSLSDLSKVDQGDKTFFTVGNYKTVTEATKRAAELGLDGFTDIEILTKTKGGDYEKVNAPGMKSSGGTSQPIAKPNTTEKQVEINTEPAVTPVATETDDQTPTENSEIAEEAIPDQVVFRVQLGAFKSKPTDPKYAKLPNLFIVQAGEYYRYMTGSFTNFADAAAHKVKMVVEGYKGAFVVAYKNGKRVSLGSVGVDSINSDPLIGK